MMTRWIKTISLIIIASGIAFGSWWLEKQWENKSQQTFLLHTSAITQEDIKVQGVAEVNHEGSIISVIDSTNVNLGDSVKSLQQPAIIAFSGSVIRLAPESELKFIASSNEGYIVKILQGRIWLFNRFGRKKIDILADNVLLLPGKTIADISTSSDDILIRVLRSDITVGLLPDGYKPKELVQNRSSDFINSFLIAQGGQARINFSQIRQNAETISKLLSSKLMKEFQYGLVDQAALNNEDWITMNRKADDLLEQEVQQNLKKTIENRPPQYPSLTSTAYQFQQIESNFFDKLTFIENKQKERHQNDIMAYFFDAEYLLLFNRSLEAEEYLKIFQEKTINAFNEADSNEKNIWQKMLKSAAEDLEFVTPDDPLFQAKIIINNVFSLTLDDNDHAFWEKIENIRSFLDEAYVLAPDSFTEARASLQQYYDGISLLLKQNHKEFEKFQYVMAEENQRMEQLLRQSPEFYRDSYFQMKYFLESEWLKLLPENESKNEERQTIMSSKVDFLKQLQMFFLDQKIGLEDARMVALRLINEMRDLQTTSGLGIDQLFALRLKDYGTFLRFLNASNTAVLKGSSPREKYNDFLGTQKEQVSIEKAINEFLGQEAETIITPSQVLDKVKAEFSEVGVKQIKLGPLESIDEKFVTVTEGVLGESKFSALYDWDRKLISQIKVGETMILIAPTRLANLPILLKTATKSANSNTNQTSPSANEATKFSTATSSETTSGTSKSEKVAKILLIQKLKSANIATKESGIIINDLKKGLFQIKNAQIIEANGATRKEILLDFDFDNKNNTVRNLTSIQGNTSKVLEGEFTLENMLDSL